MSYTPNQISETSLIGINSDAAISGGNWVADTYTGTFELNDYAYAGVNLQVDEAGTLFFDFSQDGVNFSSYPVAGVDVASGINEVHTAWKGGRYFRVRFIGTGGRSFFRLKTFFSHHSLPLSAPLNQGIGSDQDATVVRAVGIGENPAGSYTNQKVDGQGYVTTTPLAISAQYDTGVLDLQGYTQVQTHIVSDVDGTITVEFCSDSGGTVVRTLTIPYSAAAGFQLFSAPAFTPYVRYKYDNGGTIQTSFFFETKFLTKSLSGQLLGMDAFIASGMVANLGRNVIVGQEPDGNYTNLKADGVAFRTETPLGIGASYVSPITSTEGYSQIETHLYSDVEGTLTGRWYNDASKTTLLRTFTRPYAGDEVGSISYFSSPVFGPYLEYTYTNGGGSQTEFFLDFHPRTKGLSGQVLGMNDFIPAGVVANLGRNVIVGQDNSGTFRNVPTDTEGHLKVNINDPLTAFGDLRTAELTPQVHLTFPYNINSDMVNTALVGSGTVTQSNSMAVLNTTAAATSSATMSSRNVVNYRSGLGTLARFTAMFTTGVANSEQTIGIGDDDDGFFVGYDGANFGILVRRGGIDTWTAQTSFNVDTLDGNGGQANPSNKSLIHTNLNVFEITFQWLGAGEIEFHVEDAETGGFIPIHRIKYANAFQQPSIYNPSLTLYAKVLNDTNTSDIQLNTASMAGFTEGKNVVTGPINSSSGSGTSAVEVSHFHIRNKGTYLTKTNKVRCILKALSCGNDTNGISVFTIYRNATLGGVASWTDINGDDSVVEVDTVATYTSGGKVLFKGAVGQTNGNTFDLDSLDIKISPNDIITITSETEGNSGLMVSSLIWQEDF